MPLDPQARKVLEALSHPGGKSIREKTLAEARRDAYAFVDLFGAPEPVAGLEHRFIPGPSADLPIRVYTPEGVGPFPCIVYFHGSGFVISNIGIFDAPSRVLANRSGCVVISVNYQKAPEHKFPVPFDDAYASVEWIVEHAAEFGVDPGKIVVMGDSAGGTLAAAVCLKARDVGGPRPAAQILVHMPASYGADTVSMFENAHGMLLEREDMIWFGGQYLRDEADAANPYAAPLAARSFADLPPALVVTAEYDVLRDEAEQYAEALRSGGVPVVLRRFDGMIHGFYGMVGVLDAARELYGDISDFLVTHRVIEGGRAGIESSVGHSTASDGDRPEVGE
jgi:acetyl esterase